MPTSWRGLSTLQIGACLWLFAFAVRVLVILLTGSYEVVELGEANRIALALAQSGRFANPFGVETGPTAHTAPVFPLLFSLLIRLTGDLAGAELFKQLGAAGFSAATYALLPAIARRLHLPMVPAVVVAAVFAAVPLFTWVETQTWWDHLMAPPLMMLVCAQVYDLIAAPGVDRRRALVTGVSAGILVLVYPSTLLAVMALVLVYCTRATLSLQPRLVTAATIVFMMGVVVAPWIINRSMALGGFVFLRTGDGIAMNMGLNPDAARFLSIEDPGFDDVIHERYSPNRSPEELRQFEALGEWRYNRTRVEAGTAWVKAHPAEAASMIARRTVNFWFPNDRKLARKALQAGMTMAGVIGLMLMWRDRHPAFFVLCPTLVAFSVPYCAVHLSARYRHPILWILLLATAFLVGRVVRSPGAAPRGPRRAGPVHIDA